MITFANLKKIGYGLDGPGGDCSSLFRVQIALEVNSASYKMCTGGFPGGVKAAERRIDHPTTSYCHGCVYVHPCIHILRGP